MRRVAGDVFVLRKLDIPDQHGRKLPRYRFLDIFENFQILTRSDASDATRRM
jgi:hypothetical protein